MRLSISNLAWPAAPVADIAPRLRAAGMDGIEVAPTAIWPDAPMVDLQAVEAFAFECREHGLSISGIQSLLFGHPDLKLFDQSCWPALLEHLAAMIRIGQALGVSVAVFGSPRNRTRGSLTVESANEIAAQFLSKLEPALAESKVILTLEPNSPAYGADYLTTYEDAVALTDLVDSPWVQPQIDTGCLTMVGDDPKEAIQTRMPQHFHVSTPNLAPPPGPIDHEVLSEALRAGGYDGWAVLEMLQAGDDPLSGAVDGAVWLKRTYGWADS